MRSVRRASSALDELAELLPDTAERITGNGETEDVPVGELEEGDLVVITAGFPVGGPGSTNTVTVKAIGEKVRGGRRSWREPSGMPPLPFDDPPADEDAEET
ncbi:MAG: hypothetical protein ACOC5E_00145, partial [Acidobacteriota bacterium]